jgi:outer membrane immunogenic protein
MMKRLIASTAALLLSTAFTQAADLAARPYTKAPAPIISPVYNWGGFYVGANGGGGSSHGCWTALGTVFAVVIGGAVDDGCSTQSGAVFGGQAGYRWQSTNWVFGVEAQGDWANFRSRFATPITNTIDNNSKTNSFGLFTGQVGYAINNVLFYVKGGAAVTDNSYSKTLATQGVINLGGAPLFVGQPLVAGSDTRWGGTVGAGVEFGFAPNWSVGLEYDHLFMGSKRVVLNAVAPFIGAQPGLVNSIRQDVDVATVRVNYTFGGPVVARY